MTHTRDEILAMDAAQLRLAIAEAKGWSGFETLKSSGRLLGKSPEGKWYDTVPNWPASISAAWELVEEMPIAVDVMKIAEGLYFCGCNGSEDFQGYHFYPEAISTTAPLAICKCWLMWKEGV